MAVPVSATLVGQDWGPVPVWEVLMDDGTTIQAHGATEAEAMASVTTTETETQAVHANETQMQQNVKESFIEMSALEAKMVDGTATTAEMKRLLFLCSRNLRRLAKLTFGETQQAV